jgi:S-adenosyl methyltransferase
MTGDREAGPGSVRTPDGNLGTGVPHRSQAQVAAFFDGPDLAWPGIVPVRRWLPDRELEASAPTAEWSGVAAKKLEIATKP